MAGAKKTSRSVASVESLRVCLIHTPCADLDDDHLEAPLGLLYLASSARQAGHEVVVVDLTGTKAETFSQRVPTGWDVYGLSTYSVNFGLTAALAAQIKLSSPRSVIVAGGPHASALPDDVLRAGFDHVISGEGESAFVELLRRIASGVNDNARIITGQPVAHLDDLPPPAYELVDVESYTRVVEGKRCLSVLTSRGCPFKCTFCNSTIMGAGQPLRFRSAGNVVAELQDLRRIYGISHFRFQDDIFAFNIRRIRELTRHLKPLQITYRCFSRVNTCSAEMARLLKDGGCVHVSFGVESGSPKILAQNAMNKGQTPEQIVWALENAHEAGLRTRIFLIVGFPGETDQTIEETLKVVKSAPWDEFSVYPLIAYPGTPIHDEPGKFGITHVDRTYSKYLQVGRGRTAGFTIRTAGFDEDKVCRWRDYVIQELQGNGRQWAGESKKFR
ncbi:MAG: B12-binding domain-containing radical SAM protein [Propionibacteriaceae bacterium]|jgi:radical SAM superfamily enzyme YgiQ (UPF0313 family)|nr:B12-binding domain-containing radical SAM protein [Propionibacteriaceae bacterium]